MTTSLKNRLAIVFLCLLAASAAFGQNVAPELNITLGEQRVRFAPTRSFQEMRLEVVNSVGEVVFTHTTTEAEFDWNLRAAFNVVPLTSDPSLAVSQIWSCPFSTMK